MGDFQRLLDSLRGQQQPQQTPLSAPLPPAAPQQGASTPLTELISGNQKRTGRQLLADAVGGFAAGFQGQGGQFLAGLDEKRRKAGATDLLRGYNLTKAAMDESIRTGKPPDFTKILDFANERKGILKEIDPQADSGDTEAFAQAVQVEPFITMDLAVQELRQAEAQGDINLPKNFAVDKIADLTKQGRRLGFEGVDLENFVKEGVQPGASKIGQGLDKNQLEIRKEARTGIRKQLTAVAKAEQAVTTNFNKIDNLATQMQAGNRTATASALVALVKLGEPNSTVREAEAKAQLNTPDPSAALMQYFLDNGTSKELAENALRIIDPLNPKFVNVDEFKATARALVASSSPGIQAAYADAVESGTTLSKSGRQSLFTKGLEKRVGALSGLAGPATTGGINLQGLSDEELRRRIAEAEGG